MWLLCKNPYQWKPENEWLTNPLLRSDKALISCLQPNKNPRIREETSHWHGVLTQIVKLILQGRLFIGHQVTGYLPSQEKTGLWADLLLQRSLSVFRAARYTCEARWASNANGTYYCYSHRWWEWCKVCQCGISRQGLYICRIFPSTLWFYKRMHSSQLHRWLNSEPPPTQSAEYAQQALAYLERHSGLSDGISALQRDFCAQAHDREHRCSCEPGLNGLSD